MHLKSPTIYELKPKKPGYILTLFRSLFTPTEIFYIIYFSNFEIWVEVGLRSFSII